MRITTKLFCTASALLLLVSSAALAEAHSTTGQVTHISIHDRSNTRGLDFNERQYAATVRLDSDPDRVYGLLQRSSGQLSRMDYAMLELLQNAMANNWKVVLRWESPISSRAPILSVTVQAPKN